MTNTTFTRLLVVHVQGDPVIGDDRRVLLEKMVDEAADADLNIIILEDTPGLKPLTAGEYIARANFLGTLSFRNRIGYVPRPGFPHETRELIENASWNWGKKVRVFSCLEDAVRWIEEG